MNDASVVGDTGLTPTPCQPLFRSSDYRASPARRTR